MGRNTLVINCDIRETRVALIEDGIIAELQIERAGARSAVGNIVLGRVTRVLPGMQAAFIDIGMERAAFLHVEDLIRPDDFEAYLYGGAREDADASLRGVGGKRHQGSPGNGEEEGEEESKGAAGDAPPNSAPKGPPSEGPSSGSNPGPLAETDDDLDDDPDAAESIDAESGDGGDELEGDDGDDELDGESAAGEALGDEGLVVVGSEGGGADASSANAARGATADDRGGRGRRRRRRRRRKGGEPAAAPVPVVARPVKEERKDPRARKGKVLPSRVSRSVPITEVVREGDQVVVQVSKEPIGTKGARVTSHVSLPGRYVVYLPTVEHVGISKRIGSARERSRLREVMDTLKPESGGLIVRTVAEGLTKKSLKADVGYLIKLWAEVSHNREKAHAPCILYSELDLVLKTARDLFTDEIEQIVIDDKDQYARLCRFVEMFMPERAKDIELYTGTEPVFDAYGIEDEIGRALSRKVPLPSGGYLIIDQAEALSAIDVNTGRYVGKGSKDLEETALKTNLEAVEEIAYQLRFRNIGGLVILDLIDMDNPSNRERVWRELERQLGKDKAKTTINRISELGLIEMTRKRTRESLSRMLHEPCFYCDGTGQIMSRTTIGYEILRQIRRERDTLPGYSVMVNAHPAVVDLMTGEEKGAVEEAERRYMRRIEFTARREYHIEQFDLQGK